MEDKDRAEIDKPQGESPGVNRTPFSRQTPLSLLSPRNSTLFFDSVKDRLEEFFSLLYLKRKGLYLSADSNFVSESFGLNIGGRSGDSVQWTFLVEKTVINMHLIIFLSKIGTDVSVTYSKQP
ncbi:hypothetical protein AVEN_254225-1 [Araneus ventricosus]|uniref:Uncharacterized protein n=1 Tax=Araneus ventricosus TaxID=182803 RepID=A0A4Y2PNW9_ARAVE|nr:hypothetical protein AVEN_254225-1 [Araneus ventricosus]